MGNESRLNRLIDRYLAGACTPEEIKRIEQWFREGGDEVKPGIRLSDSDSLRILQKIHGEIDRQEPKRISRVWFSAALFTGLLLGVLTIYKLLQPPGYVSLQTATGEIRHAWLPDSSEIWINASSALRYNKDFKHHREVLLTGEALFSVKEDVAHPFLVTTSDSLTTQVLGTKFNISSYTSSGETGITVLSGKVKVLSANTSLCTLTKNQSLSFRRITHTYTRAAIPNADAISGWTNGEWIYENMEVQELVHLLAIQYGIEVKNKCSGNLKLKASVNFSHQQTGSEIIEIFSALANCRFRIINEKLFEIYR
ncbi:FecR family protein [Flavitalea flava]